MVSWRCITSRCWYGMVVILGLVSAPLAVLRARSPFISEAAWREIERREWRKGWTDGPAWRTPAELRAMAQHEGNPEQRR